VPENVIPRCLASAQLAPNSSNSQVGRAHWVRHPEKRRELAPHVHGPTGPPSLLQSSWIFVARPDRWREHNEWMIRRLKSDPKTPAKGLQYFEKITKLVYTLGPWGVFRPFKWLWFTVRGWSTPTPREPLSLAQLATWAHKSTALACAHYMLALRAEGYDSCPMEGFDAWRVRRLLGLPRGAKITMVISAGRRAEGGVYGPRFRFDLDTFVKEHV
jgi:Nitroreductase